MKKISYFTPICLGLLVCAPTFAASRSGRFRSEVLNGLNVIRVQNVDGSNVQSQPNAIDVTAASYAGAYGEMGQEVLYDESPAANADDYKIFVPTTMYVRMGGGLNISGATKKARVGHEKYESKNSWNTTIGLGWNMSSYVRTEIAFQESTFGFKDLSASADYHTLNGMLYFDFARRYVQTGDITYRRTFVPFMGIGAGIGEYEFSGTGGAGGFLVVAPRLELGMNFMLNDMIGLDVAYQYQMNIGHGFGWNTSRSGVDNVGNVMATIRVNF